MRKLRITAFFAVFPLLSLSADAPGETMTLVQCIDEAMKNGPDALLENVSLAAGRTSYDLSAAQNGFSLDGSASAKRSDPFIAGRGATDERNPSDTVQAGVTLNGPFSTSLGLAGGYTLSESPTQPGHSTSLSLSAGGTIWDGYLGGRGLAAVQQAGLTLRSGEADHESKLKSIVYTLKKSYYSMLGQQRQIGVLQEALEKRKNELERVQIMFKSSDATRIDLKQAELNEASAELDLSAARNDLATARERLSALLGRPADAVYTLAEAEDLPVPALDAKTAVKTALENRTDLSKLRLSRAKGDISLALQQAQYSPTVSANAGLSWSRNWTAETDQASWNAGVQVKIPIVDSGQRDAQTRQARLLNESLDIQISQLAATVTADVKAALSDLAESRAREELARLSWELAGDKYELAKAKFDSRSISMLDLLGASVDLSTAQAGLDKAKGDVQLAVLALQNAMGN